MLHRRILYLLLLCFGVPCGSGLECDPHGKKKCDDPNASSCSIYSDSTECHWNCANVLEALFYRSCAFSGSNMTWVKCICEGDHCYADPTKTKRWNEKLADSEPIRNRMMDCVQIQSAILSQTRGKALMSESSTRPLRNTDAKDPIPRKFEGFSYRELAKRVHSMREKRKISFVFKWWYFLIALVFLASLGIFSFVVWSAATREKRCAEYWKNKEDDILKRANNSAMIQLKDFGEDAKIEVIPQSHFKRKGPLHLQKKFIGETTLHQDVLKSESIHEKLEFVKKLNEQVEIGSDVEVIDEMDLTTYNGDTTGGITDNFNTVKG